MCALQQAICFSLTTLCVWQNRTRTLECARDLRRRPVGMIRAVGPTAVLARAYMGYVESVRRVEPRLLAEIDIFACRGRVGGVDVAFKSVDGRCKISSVGAAVEELVDRSFGR